MSGGGFDGRIDTGDEFEFMGVGNTFSQEPFMLTFTVARDEPDHLKHLLHSEGH
jgi:hypothetical protein